MRKWLSLFVVVAACLAVWRVGEPAPAQDSFVTPEGFTAVARAQLETLHYMAHIYRAKYGQYPPSLSDLRDSRYCVIELTNLYSGLPVQQIGFIPQPEDFSTETVLPGGLTIPSLPSPEEEGGDSFGQGPPEQGASGAGAAGSEGNGPPPPLPVPSSGGRRIDPQKVPLPAPGDLLYWTEGDSLQLVIFSDTGTWEELWMPKPYSYLADRLSVAQRTGPLDDLLVAEVAMHLERMLPAMVGRHLFLTTGAAPDPRQLADDLAQMFPQYASTLCLTYLNPLRGHLFMPAADYSPGDLALAPWLPRHTDLLYFLPGQRARSLDELIDANTLRLHSAEAAHRDKTIKAHVTAPQPPDK